MPIPVECRTCGAQLKVKEEYAGTLARCPKCKMGISIPKLDDLDFVDELPAPQPVGKRRPIPTRAAPIEDELEFLDPEEELPKLPAKRKKKKKTVLRKADAEAAPGGRGDILVWVFLLAMLPLGILSILPERTMADRLQKMVEKDPELQEELEEFGPEKFVAMNKGVTLDGAHLSRDSLVHWVYAFVASVAFLALMNAMRHMTKVTIGGLMLTGVLTGTIGILMLLAFQVIAELSLHIRVMGGGIAALIILVIKFIVTDHEYH